MLVAAGALVVVKAFLKIQPIRGINITIKNKDMFGGTGRGRGAKYPNFF
jgi:hypothetical protein